jgi:hypothetical protein
MRASITQQADESDNAERVRSLRCNEAATSFSLAGNAAGGTVLLLIGFVASFSDHIRAPHSRWLLSDRMMWRPRADHGRSMTPATWYSLQGLDARWPITEALPQRSLLARREWLQAHSCEPICEIGARDESRPEFQVPQTGSVYGLAVALQFTSTLNVERVPLELTRPGGIG